MPGVREVDDASKYESSALLGISWKRVVLDEGHVMGASSDSNKALILEALQARARWICTGTPTPATPASELMHLHGLMSFLSISPFASADVWRRSIVAPFERFQTHAWARLYSLLSRTMLRSSKDDMERIGEIPACHVITTRLELNNTERRAYNGLISIIKRNLILAGGGGSNVDSLLHERNRKYAREVC